MTDRPIASTLDGVARHLQAGHPGLEIRSLEYLADGDFCRAYVLNRHLVVRVPRHGEAARALAREACVLASVGARLPVTVPLPTYVARGEAPDASFSVHVRVPGRELTPELWRSFPAAVRARLAMDVGRFLRRVHHLDVALGGTCGLDVMDHAGLVAWLWQRIREAPGPVPGPLRRALDERFSAYLEGGDRWAYDPVLLHGDLGPGHVLIEVARARITGVIDWGDVAIGDPARDFIFVYEDWGSEFLELALEGYGSEPKERIRPRVHMHYLADQLAWTLRAAREGRPSDVEHGIEALERSLTDFGSLYHRT